VYFPQLLPRTLPMMRSRRPQCNPPLARGAVGWGGDLGYVDVDRLWISPLRGGCRLGSPIAPQADISRIENGRLDEPQTRRMPSPVRGRASIFNCPVGRSVIIRVGTVARARLMSPFFFRTLHG
jgi:hypothetical protein